MPFDDIMLNDLVTNPFLIIIRQIFQSLIEKNNDKSGLVDVSLQKRLAKYLRIFHEYFILQPYLKLNQEEGTFSNQNFYGFSKVI